MRRVILYRCGGRLQRGLLVSGLLMHGLSVRLTAEEGLTESSGCLEPSLRGGIAGGADHRSEQGVCVTGRRENLSAETPHICFVDLCP